MAAVISITGEIGGRLYGINITDALTRDRDGQDIDFCFQIIH